MINKSGMINKCTETELWVHPRDTLGWTESSPRYCPRMSVWFLRIMTIVWRKGLTRGCVWGLCLKWNLRNRFFFLIYCTKNDTLHSDLFQRLFCSTVPKCFFLVGKPRTKGKKITFFNLFFLQYLFQKRHLFFLQYLFQKRHCKKNYFGHQSPEEQSDGPHHLQSTTNDHLWVKPW